jgi:hypothetical protein
MEPRGDEGSVVVFHIHERKYVRRDYKESCKLWRERNPMTRTNIDVKALLNQKNCILKAKRITAVEIKEIKENIRLKIRDDTEDHTKGVNGDKLDVTVAEHQKRDQ